MKRLPVEILHWIFLQLPQQDKLECMEVCRHWNFVIKTYSLFHTIRISRTNQLDKLIREVRQDPTQGQKLERLILDTRLEIDFKLKRLFQHFPNVRSFTTFHRIKGVCSTINEREHRHSWNNIEYIEEHSSHLITQQLLTQHTCMRLTKISMSASDYQSGKDIICLLSNAPWLKYLTMTEFSLTLQDFELLHENTPLLKSFTFCDGLINCDIQPSEIKPAADITILEMKMVSLRNAEHEMMLLQYFGAKYPNIAELVYQFAKAEGIRAGSDVYLKFKEQLTMFISGISSKLKRLSFRFNNQGLNIFQILDDTGCKIRNISLNGLIYQTEVLELSNSNQPKYIQQLTIDKLAENIPFTCLRKFLVLKGLNIFYDIHSARPGKNFDKCSINKILGYSNPKLESFLIQGADIVLDHQSFIETHPLRKVSFIKCNIPSYIDSFLSYSFPHLRSLIFDSCKFKDKALIFQRTSLQYFKMVCSLPKSLNDIQVISLESNERRRYSSIPSYFHRPFDSNDPFFYPAVTSIPDAMVSSASYMTFVFNLVYTCFVMNSIY